MRWMGDDPLYYVEIPATENVSTDVEAAIYTLDYNEAVEAGKDALAVKVINYGDEAGFILTDFIYPGELVCDAGETITSVLDKIIAILGNYEYFYDVYGNFIFQEIKNYLNITYTTQYFKNLIQYSGTEKEPSQINYDVDLTGGKAAYVFAGSNLISSFSNTPKYSNIKNDYMIWGVRKSPNGTEIPIRYHLAIDTKPDMQYDNEKEEFYYQEHKHIVFYEDEFGVKRAKVWVKTTNEEDEGGVTIRTYDWREELYFQGIEASSTGSDYSWYFTELVTEWPKLWDFDTHKFKDYVNQDPANIDFFLDIIDSGAEVGQYNVSNIGRRSQVISDDKINCIFEQEVPDMVLINIEELTSLNYDKNAEIITETDAIRAECETIGQNYIQVPSTIYNLLAIGGIQNSCYQRVCESLYQYTNMNNTITIQAIPIYYLEPNMRINVQDPASGIFGDFMIQTISLPLTIDGQMSITANKALQKI